MYFWPWISGGMGLLMRVFYSSSTKGLVQGNGSGNRALIKRKLSYACRTQSGRLLLKWAI